MSHRPDAQNSWLTDGPLLPAFLGSSTEWMLGSTPPVQQRAPAMSALTILHLHLMVVINASNLICCPLCDKVLWTVMLC